MSGQPGCGSSPSRGSVRAVAGALQPIGIQPQYRGDDIQQRRRVDAQLGRTHRLGQDLGLQQPNSKRFSWAPIPSATATRSKGSVISVSNTVNTSTRGRPWVCGWPAGVAAGSSGLTDAVGQVVGDLGLGLAEPTYRTGRQLPSTHGSLRVRRPLEPRRARKYLATKSLQPGTRRSNLGNEPPFRIA